MALRVIEDHKKQAERLESRLFRIAMVEPLGPLAAELTRQANKTRAEQS